MHKIWMREDGAGLRLVGFAHRKTSEKVDSLRNMAVNARPIYWNIMEAPKPAQDLSMFRCCRSGLGWPSFQTVHRHAWNPL
jgi:hypothetical protein